jgi:hypothetical protein
VTSPTSATVVWSRQGGDPKNITMRVIDVSQEGIRKGTVFEQVGAVGEKGTFGIRITSPPG